ncbi:hypothetical protein GGX14DRAFT_479779 [Mycena pura]|uniref:Uncharacterized protein n=1 Tax=Mycena pura TaxID=153505 RepID=A0AAD6UQW6_9AGAR|nr:hypothetical protein GGX14DRAFT_479779 [Mycena pura]
MDNEAGSKTTFELTSENTGSTSGATQLAGNFTAAMAQAGTAGNNEVSSPAGSNSEFDPYIDSLQLMPYFESRSQQSPIKSHDASKEPLREDEAGPPTVYLGISRRYNFSILLPALMTSLISAGTASALLGWLVSRRVKSADSNAFQGALVAIEGPPTIFYQIFGPVHNDGGVTTMYGLALSSLAVHVVLFTIPFVLGVFAYLLANMWLKGQKCGHVGSLPTPTQYGHLVGLCGSSGIQSVYETAKYLLVGRRKRPAVSTTLAVAFCATSVALLVNYSLSIADLWLHTTTTTFSYGYRTPIPFDLLPAMGSRIDTSLCPGPVPYILNGTLTGYSNCQHFQPNNNSDRNVSWGDAALVNEGAAVLGNSSLSSQIQSIENLASLLPKDLPSGVQNLVFNTFAMEATCKPVSDCQENASYLGSPYSILCSEFTPPFAVSGENSAPMLNQFNSTNNALIFQSDILDLPASGVGPIDNTSGAGYALGSAINPAGVLVVLYWDGGELSPPDDLAGWYNHTDSDKVVTYSFYLSSCVLDVWDITLSYSAPSNGSAPSFTIVSSETHSDFNTTSALLAALDTAHSATLASYLTTTLQRSLSVTSEEFSNFLAGNLSQGILAYAAPLTERLNSTSGEALNSVTASRYLLAPLCLVLALTYGYSLLAFGVGITAFTLSSREITCHNAQAQNAPQRIQELDLLHLRLTSPRACIADRFHASEPVLPVLKEDIFKEAQCARRLGAGFLLSDGTVHCSDGGSGITLRNVRRFTVDIVEEPKEDV